jgi:hypothetical protein
MKHKVKKLAGGGLSGIAETASSLMNDVDSMSNKINYGNESSGGVSEPVGFSAVSGMKKGGMVSSASKRADGCAQRGKTKGRMI